MPVKTTSYTVYRFYGTEWPLCADVPSSTHIHVCMCVISLSNIPFFEYT